MNFKWDLLENALDFIYVALERLSENKTKQDLKYGLLHMASGVELLFKEALRREHWSLIFRDPDQATTEALQSGDFKSVDFDSCLKRLENISKIQLSKAQRTELLGVRQRRNRLEHFGMTDSNEAVIASTAHLMSMLVDFMKDRLTTEDWDASCKEYYNRITEKLWAFGELVDRRNNEIEGAVHDARKDGTVFVCPVCVQVALVLGNPEKARCLLCRYEASPDDAAGLWVRNNLGTSRYEVEKEGGVYPVYECPECERETLVDTEQYGEVFGLERYICFNCGEVYKESSMRDCDACGRLYHTHHDDDLGLCFDCFKALSGPD